MLVTLSEYAGAQAEMCQEILPDRSAEQFTAYTKLVMKHRSQQKILMW